MKANVFKCSVVVLLGILASGCSSIRARTEILDKGWMAYPGVQQDAKEMGEIFSGERPEPGWINALVASILIVDLPFSVVFDTIAAPYDLYRIYTPSASGETGESSVQTSDQAAAGAGKEK